MCKNAGLLIGWDFTNRRAVIAGATCDSWDCAECSKRMVQRWKMRAAMGARAILRAGEVLDFCTITSHEKLATFADTERVFRAAWPTLYSALKRRKPGLMYFMIPERHKDGRMHVHALWNAGVTKRWLKDNARGRGFGYEDDVKHLTDERGACAYVVKYLSKSLGGEAPERFRRVRVSQNWPDVPKPNSEDSGLTWEYTNSEEVLFAWLREAGAKGIRVLDQKTKEAFDYASIEWAGDSQPVPCP